MKNWLRSATLFVCLVAATGSRGDEPPKLLEAPVGREVEDIAFLTESSLIGFQRGHTAGPFGSPPASSGSLVVWKLGQKAPAQVQTLTLENRQLRVDIVAVSQDGKRILVCESGGLDDSWTVNWELGDKNNGRAIASIKNKVLRALSPDGKLAVLRKSGLGDLFAPSFDLRDANTFELIGHLPLENIGGGDGSIANRIVFTPDNKHLLVSYSMGAPGKYEVKKGVHVFDLATRKAVRSLDVGGQQLTSLSVDPSGKRLAVLADETTVTIFNLDLK